MFSVKSIKIVLSILICVVFSSCSTTFSPEHKNVVNISDSLSSILKESNVPGIVAKRVDNGKITVKGVAGLRDRNQKVKMTDSDVVHFGSMFKVQTATLCGILVSEGKLSWNARFLDFVPKDLKKQFLKTDKNWGKVTLKGLLSMSSGLDDNDYWNDERFSTMYTYTRDTVNGRKYTMQQLSKVKLKAEQGKRYSYSNIGYTMAGLIAERAWNRNTRENKTYEQLMKEKLFNPLGIKTATLGAPGLNYNKAVKVNASNPTPVVIGHNMENNMPAKNYKKGEPVGLGYVDADNPLCISPAGTWAMSLGDYLKLLNVQMQNEQTELLDKIGLNISELNTIRKPVINVPNSGFSFSLGWAVDNRNKNHLVYTGSNQRWVSKVDVQLDKHIGLVAVTNQGGEKGNEVGSKATSAAIKILNSTNIDL